MVHSIGFEPMTVRLEGGCSIQLSYECKKGKEVYLRDQQYNYNYRILPHRGRQRNIPMGTYPASCSLPMTSTNKDLRLKGTDTLA